MIEGVEDGRIGDSVLAGRSMDLHIRNIVIRNGEEWNRSVIELGLPDQRSNAFCEPIREVPFLRTS
jgi:hypothetical protein